MPKVLIEVQGGTIQRVVVNSPFMEVVVLDWDNINTPDGDKVKDLGLYPLDYFDKIYEAFDEESEAHTVLKEKLNF